MPPITCPDIIYSLSRRYRDDVSGTAVLICGVDEEQPIFLLSSFNILPSSFLPMSRLLKIIIPLALGIGIGLAYGWLIDPVDFFDLTPDTLHINYKTDYVLMTAEAYRLERDPGLAARRLAIFGSQSPSAIAAQGLDYARTNGFADSDSALIQELVTALQAWSGIQ